MTLTTENSALSILKIWAEKLYWLQIADDGVPEFYLDNHALQTFRSCESKFVEEQINCIAPTGNSGRYWFLDLGTAVHKMIEIYYQIRKEPGFSIPAWGSRYGTAIWTALDMEYYANSPFEKEQKNYKMLGGLTGFITWMVGYAVVFGAENERFRVIGTEISFGRNKEVPLYTNYEENDSTKHHYKSKWPFRFYLTGKIDLLVDDGETIAPMDHKTKAMFYGSPILDYEIQDGMTGYVYAARHLVRKFNANRKTGDLPLAPLNRAETNKIWMNFLQTSPNTKTQELKDRYRRTPLFKTDQQLEDYRLRQIRTASKIYDLLVGLGSGVVPDQNTMLCTNYMHNICPFQSLHRLDSEAQKIVREKSFIQIKPFNPEVKTKEDKKIEEVLGNGIQAKG